LKRRSTRLQLEWWVPQRKIESRISKLIVHISTETNTVERSGKHSIAALFLTKASHGMWFFALRFHQSNHALVTKRGFGRIPTVITVRTGKHGGPLSQSCRTCIFTAYRKAITAAIYCRVLYAQSRRAAWRRSFDCLSGCARSPYQSADQTGRGCVAEVSSK